MLEQDLEKPYSFKKNFNKYKCKICEIDYLLKSILLYLRYRRKSNQNLSFYELFG